ncbi:MAG: PTS mannitol transporter subunit IICBA [Propionibacteriaceae bacterium]|jgi:PTS system mannitol-specific IIC component|nr:PTS mannitol transporter subunit IICBA [Propionibacteriaceae bacterium]
MKQYVQRAGRFLSSMVMPNIGAFIAWGLIAALFIPDGWLPNENFATLVDPMLKYLIPILIAYTGGYVVAKQRGAVVGAVAAMGVIIGADIPMILGAMIMGPVGGLAIKWFDKAVEGKIKSGFEMLVNNFSAGIIGGLLALVGTLVIKPFCEWLTAALGAGVGFLVEHGLLPLAAVFVEPAKVLFLNNAINHGIFTPLGVEQVASAGRSIFFMIESNPGPGLGLLLAYCIVGKGMARASAPGAIIVQFLGGIHEIYFPYIMMNPISILGPIVGNICSIFILQTFGGGLVAAASPGSIFAELAMTPKDAFGVNISAIAFSAIVSFAVSAALLKFFGKEGDLDAATSKVSENKAESKGLVSGAVRRIVFACDAGMGSSAMGATMLRKKLAGAGRADVEVLHSAVGEIPEDADIIVTHEELAERARKARPGVRVVAITNFMAAPEYDQLAKELQPA